MNDRHFLRLVLLLLIPICWFSKPIDLIWDDQLLIGLNPWTKDLQNLPQIWFWNLWQDIPGEHANHWYRPLMAAHLILDQQLFGENLLPRQLVSLGWYLGLCILIWRYLETWELSRRGKRLGFLFFVFHPFQLELIHFLAARNDTMVLVFSFAAILSQPKWLKISLFLLAFLSKESAVILLPLLIFGEFVKEKEWKPAALIFLLITLLYFGWKQALSLPSYFPEIDQLPLLMAQFLDNMFLPWTSTAAGFNYAETTSIIILFFLFMGILRPCMVDKKLHLFSLIFIVIFLFLAGLGASSSHSLSYRYTALPLLGICLMISNLKLSSFSSQKYQIIVLGLLGFLLTGFRTTYTQWKDSRSLWELAYQRTPSPHSACGLFMQIKREPTLAPRALDLLDKATQNPPAQHCCFHASQYPLDAHSPQMSLQLGKKALSQGCAATPELLAPLGLSEALLGNWSDAKKIASQLQTDPYGYSPLILTAEGLHRGDNTALDYWSQNDPTAKEQLRAKANQLLKMVLD